MIIMNALQYLCNEGLEIASQGFRSSKPLRLEPGGEDLLSGNLRLDTLRSVCETFHASQDQVSFLTGRG